MESEKKAHWQEGGTCPECGAQSTRRSWGSHRCRDCWRKSRITTVKPHTLKCSNCKKWLPDHDFPFGGPDYRRGRNKTCRTCQTIVKREYRARQRAAA